MWMQPENSAEQLWNQGPIRTDLLEQFYGACRSELLFVSKICMWEDDLNQGFLHKSGTLKKNMP